MCDLVLCDLVLETALYEISNAFLWARYPCIDSRHVATPTTVDARALSLGRGAMRGEKRAWAHTWRRRVSFQLPGVRARRLSARSCPAQHPTGFRILVQTARQRRAPAGLHRQAACEAGKRASEGAVSVRHSPSSQHPCKSSRPSLLLNGIFMVKLPKSTKFKLTTQSRLVGAVCYRMGCNLFIKVNCFPPSQL